jgi:HD-like signal output (HDOD) protein
MQVLVQESVKKLDPKKIRSQVASCPALPSLGSISKALQDLLFAEQRYSAQISEVIRRDPSLTARLLRLVNSVYYGLSNPVNNIEEAVFYLDSDGVVVPGAFCGDTSAGLERRARSARD